MVQTHKTPLQHNSTLFISPQIVDRRHNIFVTPPNPSTLFETPASSQSLFYNPLSSAAGREEPLSRVEKLRLWRHDALMQHHYATAEFIGDKVLLLTHDANDAFWLAQVYVGRENYVRAHQLLSGDPAYLQLLGCRYLWAYSLIKLEQWDDALDVLGETNPFKDRARDSTDGGIRLEASMCYLRGVVYASQNNFDRAKEAYKEAVSVDVKCYEAFHELVLNDLLAPDEQWAFAALLNYADADDNDELIKLLYTLRLSKYVNASQSTDADAVLRDEFALGDNADVLVGRAEALYVQCLFDECLAVCEQVLERDPHNMAIVPYYLCCLHELGARNRLFLKAHQLAEAHPTHPLTWVAIGTYYLAVQKVLDARKYFSKATMLGPNCGPAWVGFAHTFALEGEHEQAISAYAFGARLFPGSHVPNLFLGMQHLQMNNVALAEEYVLAAHHICSSDPLVLNELGVVCYHKGALREAETRMHQALAAASHLNSDSSTWIAIHVNLGHVYRRAGLPHKALDCFGQAHRLSRRADANVLAAQALVHMTLGDCDRAITALHDALAVAPGDPVAADLLKRALELNCARAPDFLAELDRESILGLREASKSEGAKGGLDQRPASLQEHLFDRLGLDILLAKDGDDVVGLAERLKRGTESSDEEVMDIESD